MGSIITSQFRTRKQYSKRFLSILHHIQHKLDTRRQSKIIRLVEMCVTELDDIVFDQENHHKVKEDLLIDQDDVIELDDGINCKFAMVKEDDPCDKMKIKITNVTANLFSYKHNIATIKNFIDECVVEYDYHLNKKLHDNLFHFVYDYQDEIETFKKVIFRSNKTFDNVFFREKDMLMTRLEFFEHQSHLYKKLGIPHTFGILMHGDPGTGKTSTIKAIANHTRRHLISVPLHKIKNMSSLTNLFLHEDIDGVHVPFSKRIYVFEEIDCNGLREIVKQRQTQLQDSNDSQNQQADIQIQLQQLLVPKSKPSSRGEESGITLGGILELIDGLVETPGRIMIITTNHPEELDTALTRPGRIDMNIGFKRMTKQDFKHMFKLWFDVELHDNELLNIKDEQYTHAEVCQMLFQNINNPKCVLLKLQDNTTQSFQL
jgi:chaperone BCS1